MGVHLRNLYRLLSFVKDLKYADTHEWVKVDGTSATIEITDHAQPHCVYPVDENHLYEILGEATHEILKELLGDGIFAVDGEKWRQQRKIPSYEFSVKVLRDYSSAVFRENAAKLPEIVLDDMHAKCSTSIMSKHPSANGTDFMHLFHLVMHAVVAQAVRRGSHGKAPCEQA
ncbi:hypothetical protein J5N97_026432 [Dioscorea zingiberensis]|uniref:Cytochrome P450 n=1 Tax=Dioscorea zingiberensis TaxID=325984 RepID=A0A9D5C3A3_9LILI|nr:hypothetical protein J5N97_026432 [Dioscorea zingiberensis]